MHDLKKNFMEKMTMFHFKKLKREREGQSKYGITAKITLK